MTKSEIEQNAKDYYRKHLSTAGDDWSRMMGDFAFVQVCLAFEQMAKIAHEHSHVDCWCCAEIERLIRAAAPKD